MTTALGPETVDRLSRQAKDPSWLAQLRDAALKEHEQLPWPNASDEIWRRTSVALLDPRKGFSVAESPLLQTLPLDRPELAALISPFGDEHLLVHWDGSWVHQQAPAGVFVGDVSQATGERAERVRKILEADGLTSEERKLTSLTTAFHRQGALIDIPAGFHGEVPLRLVQLFSARAGSAVFPLTVIVVGAGSSVTLIEEDAGVAVPGAEGPHVLTGRIELVVEPEATVRYCRIQRWHAQAREFLLQQASVQRGGQLTMININFGAAVSKTHVVAKLLGPRASSRVFGFVFGHDQQHIDFHSLQDHLAPQTMSDLLYKAALKDQSRMIYTGLIRIAKAANQTDAYQANNNLLLSRQARAETIPMLEILADDVRCKHGATVGPVDEEQLFYLMARSIPRELAERLLVMGFVDPVIAEIPFEPFQERLRQELEGSL